jgi:hypothetical protein
MESEAEYGKPQEGPEPDPESAPAMFRRLADMVEMDVWRHDTRDPAGRALVRMHHMLQLIAYGHEMPEEMNRAVPYPPKRVTD